MSKPLSGAAKAAHDKKVLENTPILMECFCCFGQGKFSRTGIIKCPACGTDLTQVRDNKIRLNRI